MCFPRPCFSNALPNILRIETTSHICHVFRRFPTGISYNSTYLRAEISIQWIFCVSKTFCRLKSEVFSDTLFFIYLFLPFCVQKLQIISLISLVFFRLGFLMLSLNFVPIIRPNGFCSFSSFCRLRSDVFSDTSFFHMRSLSFCV